MDEGSSNNAGNPGRADDAAVSPGRRRLTAAAFAAPMIVTLSAPRTAAAASLAVTERLDQQWSLANATEPQVVGSNETGSIQWARDISSPMPIFLVRLKNGGSSGSPELYAFYDGSNYRSVEWPGNILDVKTAGNDAPLDTGQSGFKLLFFTYDGQALTQTTAGTPLTVSCWASLGSPAL